MKFYTHPKRKQTLIQRKDGRTYEKNWVYFRALLRTENDEKNFTFIKAQESLFNYIQIQTSSNTEQSVEFSPVGSKTTKK